MEILQTIWTALTSENEKLTLIVCSPLTFIEVYLSTLIFTKLLNIEASNKKRLLKIKLNLRFKNKTAFRLLK